MLRFRPINETAGGEADKKVAFVGIPVFPVLSAMMVYYSVASIAAFSALITAIRGHGAMVTPLSRNAVDALAGVNTQRCSNITGDKCNNGQGGQWKSESWSPIPNFSMISSRPHSGTARGATSGARPATTRRAAARWICAASARSRPSPTPSTGR